MNEAAFAALAFASIPLLGFRFLDWSQNNTH